MRNLLFLALIFVLIGCGANPTGTTPSELTPTEPAALAPTPESEATAEVETNDNSGEESDALALRAREWLANYLRLEATDLALIDGQETEWTTSGLGCPDPNRPYTNVVTTGYIFTYSTSIGNDTYIINVPSSGQPIILCENNLPIVLTGQAGPDDNDESALPVEGEPMTLETVQTLVLDELVRDLGVDRDAVSVEIAERVTWSDSSLGCPDPETMYMQVITPGYRFVFRNEGELFAYHSDMRGYFVRCEKVTLEGPVPGTVEDM